MPNRLCHQQLLNPPLFLANNIKLDRIPTKIIKNTCPFYTVFQVLNVLIKIYEISAATSSFVSYCFTLVFTFRANIIFHKFLELHSALSEKKIFVTNFPFLTDSL